jgi:hypothetical protein
MLHIGLKSRPERDWPELGTLYVALTKFRIPPLLLCALTEMYFSVKKDKYGRYF